MPSNVQEWDRQWKVGRRGLYFVGFRNRFPNLDLQTTVPPMQYPPIKRGLRIPQRKHGQLRQINQAVIPDPVEVRARLLMLVQTFGNEAAAVMLDVSPVTILYWLRNPAIIGPGSRRSVWTLYGMIYAPHEIATLFDYATWGRFTKDPLVVSEAQKPAKPAPKPRPRTPQGNKPQ